MSCGLSKSKVKKSNHFLEEFKQSGSMCIDALSVNLAKSNCLEVSTTDSNKDQEFFFVRCASSLDGYQNQTWNQMVFIVVQNKGEQSFSLLENNEVFCVDTKTILGVVLPDNGVPNIPNKRHLF